MSSLGSAHRGYQYQDLITAYYFALCLTSDIQSITVDRKLYENDRFDDLTFQLSGLTFRRQIKSSEDGEINFELRHLTTKHRDLEIDELIRGFKNAGANVANEYRLCATWKEPIDDLINYLEPLSTNKTFPEIDTKTFRLRTSAIWEQGQQSVWRRLRDSSDITRQDFIDFADRFVIELEFPSASTDLSAPGTLEILLLNLLTDSIGIGRYPNHWRNPVDVAVQLVQLANSARTQSKIVSKTEIETAIQLQKDFGHVAQQFPVEKAVEVECVELQTSLHENSGSQRIILTGAPGSGKSWALTEFAESLKNENRLVARHYCYLEPGDPQVQRRVTTDVLFGNLIYELIEAKPELKNLHQPVFAAGPRELEQLLEKAFAQGIINECILIVDGIDHISRVFADATNLSIQDVDIVEELAILSLPEEVCLIVGSQPGEHLEPLRSDNSVDLSIPVWTVAEVTSLAEKIGALNQLEELGLSDEEIETFITQLYQRSEGNPLYATFLCRQLVLSLQSKEVLNPFDYLSAVPQLNGQISNYYQYLFDSLEKNSFGLIMAELLGTIDFGLSENDIREIYPQFRTHISDAINFLMPILIQTSAQGGTRIYHESFRRFVNEKVKERGGSITEILAPVIVWLKGRDFFQDSKAYRFLLPSLRRAEQYQEILDIVNTTFVSDSLFAGHPQRAIEENIKLATYVAADRLDWVAIVRLAELRRSLIVCFQEKLEDIEIFGKCYYEIFSPYLLNERLLFDGKPTFPPHVGLLFCSLCDDAGVVPPWREYLALEEPQSQNSYGEYDASKSDRKNLNIDIARLHGALRTIGIDSFFPILVDYLEKNPYPPQKYFQLSLERIVQFGNTEVLENLIEAINLKDSTKAIVLVQLSKVYFSKGELKSAKAAADEAVKLSESIEVIADAFSLGADPNLVLGKLPDLSLIDIAVDGRRYIGDDNRIEDWIHGVKIAADIAPDLIEKEKLRFEVNNFYRAWLRFVINLSEVEAEAKNNINAAENRICEALEELASDTRPFAGEPRACDLYYIHSLIVDTIRRALILLKNTERWEVALGHLKNISLGPLVYLKGAANAPLTPEKLIKLLSPYAYEESLAELITNFINQLIERTKQSVDYYETQAEQEMLLANIFARSNQKEAALRVWNSATIKLCAYGYRKDTTIYELIESVPKLKVLGDVEVRQAVASLQPLINAVIQHTDGKDTRHTPIAWMSSLSEIDFVGAAFVLASSLVKYGGAIDWRYEEAFEEIIDYVYDSGNAHLVNFLASTQPFQNGYEGGIKNVRQRLRVIERIFNENVVDGKLALTLLAAQVHGDAPAFDPSAYEIVKDFAAQYEFLLPNVTVSVGSYTKKEESNSYRGEDAFAQFKDVPVFPQDADFSQIFSSIRMNRFLFREDDLENTRYVNALGFRLLEMLGKGESNRVIQLLQYFSRTSSFNLREASPLAELGEGFERYGYTKEASIAYSLAYARSRGGGGWLALGDSEQFIWLDNSLALSTEDGERTLANELVYWLNDQHHILGITRHLIEFCAEHKPDIVADVWKAAFDVIQHRLPENEKDPSIFRSYNPRNIPSWSSDEAMIMLLFARVSHPEFFRKRAALAGIAAAISRVPEQVINPLKHFLSLDTPITSVLLVLHVLIESEGIPYQVTNSIQEELKNLCRSDIFGFQILSQILLERIGQAPDKEIVDISGLQKSSSLSDRKKEAILSLDWEKRVEEVSRIWDEFPNLVAERFDYIWETKSAVKERSKGRLRAALNSSYEDLPATPMISWEEEIFEYVFHEVLAGIFEQVSEDEEFSSFINNTIGSKVLSDVHLQIANYYSRTPRPFLILPSKQLSAIEEVHPLNDSDQYVGWYRCGYFERELLISNDRRFDGFLSVMEGIEFHDNFASITMHPPFAETEGANWWTNSEWEIDLAEFYGPLVGCDLKKDLLGMLPLLILHPAISKVLNLEPAESWQSPLILFDENGETAVRFRSWHVRPVGSSINSENVILEGCDLIIRPDIFLNLTAKIGKPYRHIKIILPEKNES